MSVLVTAPEYPQPTRLERALDLIFPPLCVGCRKIGRWICDRCWRQVPWLLDEVCGQCGRALPAALCPACGATRPLASLIAVTEFEGIGREAVHALKFHNHHAISSMMGRLMAYAVRGVDADVVVPVPLHRSRRRERGYDQSAMLARAVARSLDRRYDDGLRRSRATQQQALLASADRSANVAGAFASRHAWPGEAILLVDDVSTTGATLRSAAHALKDAGAGPIAGLVFARAQ